MEARSAGTARSEPRGDRSPTTTLPYPKNVPLRPGDRIVGGARFPVPARGPRALVEEVIVGASRRIDVERAVAELSLGVRSSAWRWTCSSGSRLEGGPLARRSSASRMRPEPRRGRRGGASPACPATATPLGALELHVGLLAARVATGDEVEGLDDVPESIAAAAGGGRERRASPSPWRISYGALRGRVRRQPRGHERRRAPRPRPPHRGRRGARGRGRAPHAGSARAGATALRSRPGRRFPPHRRASKPVLALRRGAGAHAAAGSATGSAPSPPLCRLRSCPARPRPAPLSSSPRPLRRFGSPMAQPPVATVTDAPIAAPQPPSPPTPAPLPVPVAEVRAAPPVTPVTTTEGSGPRARASRKARPGSADLDAQPSPRPAETTLAATGAAAAPPPVDAEPDDVAAAPDSEQPPDERTRHAAAVEALSGDSRAGPRAGTRPPLPPSSRSNRQGGRPPAPLPRVPRRRSSRLRRRAPPRLSWLPPARGSSPQLPPPARASRVPAEPTSRHP